MIYGRIYKIYSNETGECYYGSTKQTLSRRLSKHKSSYKSWKKGERNYVTSFKIIERGNFTISLIEADEFENKDYMKARERHYIENNECVNKNIPNRSQKEYREANKEKKKEYREAHKEEIKEYREANKEKKKEWYEAHKEKAKEYGKEYYQAHKEEIAENMKEYREAHKEQLTEYKKKYNEANKEKILEKITCECGKVICRGSKVRHQKSQYHIDYLAYTEQK